MVHQFKNNGYNIVMDICSGAVHVVDDAAYDVISLYEDHSLVSERGELRGCGRSSPRGLSA
jgi:uncharacterized protein